MYKTPSSWTPSQETRAGILFKLYPDIKQDVYKRQHLREHVDCIDVFIFDAKGEVLVETHHLERCV